MRAYAVACATSVASRVEVENVNPAALSALRVNKQRRHSDQLHFLEHRIDRPSLESGIVAWAVGPNPRGTSGKALRDRRLSAPMALEVVGKGGEKWLAQLGLQQHGQTSDEELNLSLVASRSR